MKRSAIRELLKLTTRPDMISFAGGLPAPELFPMEAIREASDAVLRQQGPAVMQYGETEGVAELRDWVAQSISTPERPLGRNQILITNGAQQALDLIGRVFVDEGDTILVENPTYLAALSAWRPCGARFESIPDESIDPDASRFRGQLERPAKLVYLVPNFSNPTGNSLSEERRHTLARQITPLGQGSTVWVEDDPYGALRYDGVGPASLFQRAGARWGESSPVLRVGTFSKVLVPGLRVGWVTGPEPLVDALVRAKQAADLHSSPFNQWLVLELLRRGLLETQHPRWTELYRARRNAMLEALAEFFPPWTSWTRPDGGMFVWVTLPHGMNSTTLLNQALARGVAFVPGAEFHIDDSGQNTFRLNFTHAPPERIREGIRRLSEVIRRSPCG
jgi:2-aminoadipate transaminase